MTRALGLSAFVLALLSPFVDFINASAIAAAFFIALIVWAWLRYREPPIDEVKLQCELEGFVRDLNRHG